MGLLPSQFYQMRYVDFVSMQNGFLNKKKGEQRLLRRAVTLLLNPYMDKGKRLSDYQIWPVDGDEELIQEDKDKRIEISEASLKRLQEFKDRERNQKSKEN